MEPTANPYFEAAASWDEARQRLSFEPIEPKDTAGFELEALRIQVADIDHGELAPDNRSLEAFYGGFVLTQAEKGVVEARRWALEVSYGPDPDPVTVAGHPGMGYDLGPEPPPDDIDPRMPAVVTWHDDDRFFLLASATLETERLLDIALSLYE